MYRFKGLSSAFPACFKFFSLVVLLFFAFSPVCTYAQDGAIDPQAEKVLKAMCRYIEGLSSFEIKGQTAYDVITDSGQKITYFNQIEILLKRPDRLYVHRVGMVRDQDIYYDGKSLTLFDRKRNLYASTKVPENIDKMLDYAKDVLNLAAPGSDLLYSDIFKGLTEDTISGSYIGKNRINGILCHHIAFRNSEVDFQMWIQDGENPVPRKFIITSKWMTGAPQYMLTIFDLTSKKLDNKVFHFSPPKDAHKVAFLTPEYIERLRKSLKEQGK